MATLVEAEIYEAGVYQLEITDPVIGGPDGIDNLQAKQLANRTNWLKAKIDSIFSMSFIHTAVAENPGDTDEFGYWDSLTLSLRKVTLANLKNVLFGSPTLTGNPLTPTPPQFDNDTSIASTEFIQRALGSKRGMLGLGISTVLTASAHAGQVIFPTANTLTFTLPLASSCPSGTVIGFDGNGYGATIIRQGTDTIGNGLVGSVTTSSLLDTDSVSFMSNGSGVWYIVSGEVRLAGSSSFANLKAVSGYQKLPSGLIIQWGSLLANAGTTAFTFPIAFPSACRSCTASSTDTTGATYRINVTNITQNGGSMVNTYTSQIGTVYIAIGY